MVDWVSQVKKVCQDYLAPRAIVEKLALLALDTQVLVEFVDHQVTLEWMGFQDKQVCQALQVGIVGSALTLKRVKLQLKWYSICCCACGQARRLHWLKTALQIS